MTGKNHLMLGTAIGASVIVISQNYTDGAVFMAACMLGSIFPDIDLPDTMIGHTCKPLAIALNRKYGHRGFIHSPLNAALLTFIYWGLTYLTVPTAFRTVALGFLVGFFAHLLQDTFTKKGIPWLYPLKYKIHFTNISSDSFICFFITLGLIAGWICLLFKFSGIAPFLVR